MSADVRSSAQQAALELHRREALRLIREEHSELGALIHGMLVLARRMEQACKEDAGKGVDGKKDRSRGADLPPLRVLRAMLYYISEYPERLHHPKEDRYLFAPLRRHTRAFDAQLDQLEAQHGRGESLVHRLEHLLTRVEFEGARAIPAFVRMAEEYSQFYYAHMKIEEELILPAAEVHFDEVEWQAMHFAFQSNPDLLSGHDPRRDFEAIFSLIVNTAPAPVGLG